MAWWGKLLGGAFGFVLGGPLGAILGTALGHGFDRGLRLASEADRLEPGDRERVQTAFFTATFSVLGHVAKVDGRVSEQEIGLAETLMTEMDLTPEMRRTAIRLFTEGKSPGFPLDEVLDQLRAECHRRHTLVQMFLEIQLNAAYADGLLNTTERRLLEHIAGRLGFSPAAFRRLEDMIRAERGLHGRREERARRGPPPAAKVPLADAYAILNVSPGASDAEVKKAYRRLINQHHPDKLVAKGLPEEMMKLAAQKTIEIKQAYEAVKGARGLR
jgi:DnaJ like chaperone protein